jgi:pimeloyl-ACP methyl ester carboxylesterase
MSMDKPKTVWTTADNATVAPEQARQQSDGADGPGPAGSDMAATTVRLVDGAELHCAVSGAGEPLLLIPGLGLDHQYYRRAIPQLSQTVRVHAVDPRGIGKSTKSEPPYTVEAWADDFVELIDALDVGPMHVLGSSLGGAMAMALAEKAPDRVKSLTVVGGFSELDRAAALNFDLRMRLIERLGLNAEVADYMALWTLSRTFLNSEVGYEQMLANQKIIKQNSDDMYLAFVRSVLAWGRCLPGQEDEPKFTEKLAGISAPTLVIGAPNDTLIPLALSELIAQRIPGAELRIMPEGGHIPFIEKPDEVTEIVLAFIAAHAGD